MRSEQDVWLEVMNGILDEPGRSVEFCVTRALRAGIEFERDRIRAILAIAPPPGLQQALIACAFAPEMTAEKAAELIACCKFTPEQSMQLRQQIRLVSDAAADPSLSLNPGENSDGIIH